MLDAGCLACGIEGSDLSKKMKRAAWATIPQFLHVGDITRSYSFSGKNGSPVRFSVVTAWEVLEHLPTPDLPVFFYNIKNNLLPGGIFIASVSTQSDTIDGVELHQTIKSQEWWLETLEREGLTPHPEWLGYFGEDMVRGPQNAAHSFNIICSIDDRAPPAPPIRTGNSVLPIQERISPVRRGAENDAPVYRNIDEAMLIAPFELRLAKAPDADIIAAIRLAMDFGLSTTGFQILLTECNSTLAKHADVRVHSGNAIAQLKPIQGVITRLHYLQGLAEGFQGDYTLALGHLATAKSMGSNPFWTAYHLCNFNALSGRLNAAVVEGRRAFALRKDYPKLEELVRRLELKRDQLWLRRLQAALGSSRLAFAAALIRRVGPQSLRAFGSYLAGLKVESVTGRFLEAAARQPTLVNPPAVELGLLQEAALLFVYPGARLETAGLSEPSREFFLKLARLPSPEEEVVQSFTLGGIVLVVQSVTAKEAAKLWHGHADRRSRTLLWKTTTTTKLEDLKQSFALRPNESIFHYPSRLTDGDEGLVVVAPADWLKRMAVVPVIRMEAMAESIVLAQARYAAEHRWEELRTLAQSIVQHYPEYQAGWKILAEALIHGSPGTPEHRTMEAWAALKRAAALAGEDASIWQLRLQVCALAQSLAPANPMAQAGVALRGEAVPARQDMIRQESRLQLMALAMAGDLSRLDAYLPYDRDWSEGWRILARRSVSQPEDTNRFIRAMAELERLHPHDPEAIALRAQDAERSQAWGEAEAQWTKLVRRRPGNSLYLDRMLAARGQELAGLRKHFHEACLQTSWAKARELNELILTKDGDWAEGYLHRALLLSRCSGALPLIEKAFRDALDRGYDEREILLARAEERFARGLLGGTCQDLVKAQAEVPLTAALQVKWSKLRDRVVQTLDQAGTSLAAQHSWTKLGEILHSVERLIRNSEPYQYWQARFAFETGAAPESYPAPQGTAAAQTRPTARMLALRVRILIQAAQIEEAEKVWSGIDSPDQSEWVKDTKKLLASALFSHLSGRALGEFTDKDYEAALDTIRQALKLQPDWILGALMQRWSRFLHEGDLRLLDDLPIGYTGAFGQLPLSVQTAFSCWRKFLQGNFDAEHFACALTALDQPGRPVLETWLRLFGEWTYRSAITQQLGAVSDSLRVELAQHCRLLDRRLDSSEARWLAFFWDDKGGNAQSWGEPLADWPTSPVALCMVLDEAYSQPSTTPLPQAWNRFLAAIPEQFNRLRPADRETTLWLKRLSTINGSAGWVKVASQLRLLGWPLPKVILLLADQTKAAGDGSAVARADFISAGIEVFPHHPELLAASAEAELERGGNDPAIKRVRRLREIAPDHPLTKPTEARIYSAVLKPVLASAKIAKNEGFYELASKNYEAALALWPDCPEAHFELARILDDLRGPFSATITEYTRALENGWDPFGVHFHRGLFYFEYNHSFEAFSDLVRARRLNPESTVAQAMITLLGNRERENWMAAVDQWVNSGKYQHAIWVLAVLVETEFTSGAAHYYYGCALSWSGRNDATALAQYDLAMAGGAQEFWVRYNRAFTHFSLGNMGAALADMQEAARLDPTHEGATSTLKTWSSP